MEKKKSEKPEKNRHPNTESVEIENSVDEAIKDNTNDILDKLKTTIEKIKKITGEGAEITKKQNGVKLLRKLLKEKVTLRQRMTWIIKEKKKMVPKI